MDTQTHKTITALVAPDLRQWADIFLRARRAERLSPHTLKGYKTTLRNLVTWADGRGLLTLETLTPDDLRAWVLELEEGGLSVSTIRQYLRVARVFLNWVGEETDMPPAWRNPAARVKPPKANDTPLPPADADALAAIIATCGSDRGGLRDRAMFLALADTGCRAGELCGLDLADYDGEAVLTFRRTKNGKTRAGFLGRQARRALRAWLRERGGAPGPLFTGQRGRLKYSGLLDTLRTRAARVGVPAPKLHGIRRLFTLTALRQGVDLVSLARLLGHSNLDLLQRYAKQTTDDLRQAQARVGLGDRL